MRKHLVTLAVVAMLLPGASFAQSASESETTQVAVLADINLSNATIVSNDGKTLVVGVDIENRSASTQPDIRYGLEIVRNTEKGREKADAFVASETVTLVGNRSVHKTISYPLPTSLSGDFDVWVIARTKGGLMLGLNNAGKISLSSSGDRVTVVPDSCRLSISGDDKAYALLQGVDISENETLSLVCRVRNESATLLSLVPDFETFRRSVYGEKVAVSRPVSAAVSLAPHETKDVSIVLPKAENPQAYDISTTLKKTDGTPVSEKVIAHYVVRGESATIQNVTLDKDSYAKGDTVSAMLSITPSADGFPGSRAGEGTDVPGLSVVLSVVDGKGAACIEPITREVGSGGIRTVLSATARIDCDSPIATVAVRDAKGKAFDTSIIEHSETVENAPERYVASGVTAKAAVIAFVAFLFILSLGVIAIRMIPGKSTRAMKALLFASVLSGSMIFGSQAQAKTWTVYAEDTASFGDYFEAVYFTVNTDKTSYTPGETVSLFGMAEYLHCSNGYGGYKLTAKVGGGPEVVIGEEDFGFSGWDDGQHDIYWLTDMVTGTVKAPSVPGDYVIRLHTVYEMNGDTGEDTTTIRITVLPPAVSSLHLCVNGAELSATSLAFGDTRSLRTFYGADGDSGTVCSTTNGNVDATAGTTFTESGPDAVALSGNGTSSVSIVAKNPDTGTGQQSPTETIRATHSASGLSKNLHVTVSEICSLDCTSEAPSHCTTDSWNMEDSCGVMQSCASGTRSCEFNWKEVVPGQ